MRKALITVLIVMALIMVSCSQSKVEKFGYITWSRSVSREVTAAIDYPDVNSLTWTITATKQSTGSKVGEGTYTDVLLTEPLGSFSVGVWDFTLDGFDGVTKVYHGETEAYIAEGNNTVEVEVSPVGQNGYVTFKDCHFTDYGLSSMGQTIYSVTISVDDSVMQTFNDTAIRQREDGLYEFVTSFTPRLLSAGIHDFKIVFTGAKGQTVTAEQFKARIVGGLTTVVSFGKFEGQVGLHVLIDEQEALVED